MVSVHVMGWWQPAETQMSSLREAPRELESPVSRTLRESREFIRNTQQSQRLQEKSSKIQMKIVQWFWPLGSSFNYSVETEIILP